MADDGKDGDEEYSEGAGDGDLKSGLVRRERGRGFDSCGLSSGVSGRGTKSSVSNVLSVSMVVVLGISPNTPPCGICCRR